MFMAPCGSLKSEIEAGLLPPFTYTSGKANKPNAEYLKNFNPGKMILFLGNCISKNFPAKNITFS